MDFFFIFNHFYLFQDTYDFVLNGGKVKGEGRGGRVGERREGQ